MRESERGYTLLEMIVVVGIMAMLLAVAVPSLNQNPGVLTGSIDMVRAAIGDASSLAMANGDDSTNFGSGATLQFTTDAQTGETVARVYWGRPYNIERPSIPLTLPLDQNLPEIRTKTHIRMEVSGSLVDPPFAMFISPSGHASTRHGSFVFEQFPIRSELPCVGNFSVEFSLGTDVRTRHISCEFTTMLPDPQPSVVTNVQSLQHGTP